MYRTDKVFMKDPATVSCRIYIGGLDDSVKPENLEEKFKAHGQILGLVLQRGFGFIQYDCENAVQQAITNEHGQMFHGRKLNVKQAMDGTKKQQGQNQNQHQPPSQQQQQQQKQLQQNQQIQQEQENQAPIQLQDDATPGPVPEQQDDFPPRQMPQNLGPLHPSRKRGNRGGVKAREWRSATANRDRSPLDSKKRPDFRDRPPFFNKRDDNFGPVPPYIPPKPEKNDCEIIVVAKGLTGYAEYIEQRLKKLGLIVDLLFPNEDVPIGRVLANISSRGCLYAILVMPQNEENRSLTLNILHGIPEEHRNMPMEDALLLMTRNFDAYMRGDKSGQPGTGGSLTDRHPEAIQVLINLLAENRQLTTLQYDRIVKYLHERRELQVKHEIGESSDTVLETAEPGSKQAELQSRILNILNKSNSPGAGAKMVAPTPAPLAAPTATPLLNDPSVQKALDSLLQGDILKGIF